MIERRADTGHDRFTTFAQGSDTLFAALRGVRARVSTREGLTSSQARLLEPLERQAPMTVSALARRAGIAGSTATRMLQGLERDGIVLRRRSAQNERVVDIILTAPGRTALEHQRRELRELQRRVFDSLDEHELNLAPTLLVRLTALLNAS